MKQYFAGLPPFASNGEKKVEFPDAAALLPIGAASRLSTAVRICCIFEQQSERGTWLSRAYRRFGYWLAKIIFDVSGAPAFRMAT